MTISMIPSARSIIIITVPFLNLIIFDSMHSPGKQILTRMHYRGPMIGTLTPQLLFSNGATRLFQTIKRISNHWCPKCFGNLLPKSKPSLFPQVAGRPAPAHIFRMIKSNLQNLNWSMPVRNSSRLSLPKLKNLPR